MGIQLTVLFEMSICLFPSGVDTLCVSVHVFAKIDGKTKKLTNGSQMEITQH